MRNRLGKPLPVMDNRYEESKAAQAHAKSPCQKRCKDIEIETKEDSKVLEHELAELHEPYDEEMLQSDNLHRVTHNDRPSSGFQKENEAGQQEIRQAGFPSSQNPNQRYHDLCKKREEDVDVPKLSLGELGSLPQERTAGRTHNSLEVRQLKAQLGSVTKDLLAKGIQLEHAEKRASALEKKCKTLVATKAWLEGKVAEGRRRASASASTKKVEALKRLNKSMASQLEAKNILIFQQTRLFDSAPFAGDSQSNLSNDPMFFHFHMLVQSVKIMIEKETNVDIARLQCDKKLQSEVLYLSAREKHVEFYDWPKWIRVQFTKAHVESVYGCSAAFASEQAEDLYFAGELTDQEYFQIIEADFHAASQV